MSKYIVCKPIPVDGDVLPTGMVVDAAEWRNLRSLIAGRYLKHVVEEPQAMVFVKDDEVVKPRRGRPPKQTPAPEDPVAESAGSDDVEG